MLKKFKLIFGTEAEKDLEDIVGQYEEIRQGLGEKFNNTLDKQLELLRTQPEMYAKFKEEIRRGNLKKFPYSFYYQHDIPAELIDILAIFAQAKAPKDIEKELKKRRKF